MQWQPSLAGAGALIGFLNELPVFFVHIQQLKEVFAQDVFMLLQQS
ncbi:hypothetical protein CY0110_15907 [Crocosphaera chwakensis CCY0110]|uniref:Uncharacterized protein n=1 Tax=Crocosphaera chwakensis CCY0110 TaxID=391612 RepID=A3IHL3_9CHRO|nr:hypothetical protein CY0110_15907 [Crocosphaera chwakensis CCY0110]